MAWNLITIVMFVLVDQLCLYYINLLLLTTGKGQFLEKLLNSFKLLSVMQTIILPLVNELRYSITFLIKNISEKSKLYIIYSYKFVIQRSISTSNLECLKQSNNK